MKCTILFTFLVIALVLISSVADGQKRVCKRRKRPDCSAPLNPGRRGKKCKMSWAWYYNNEKQQCERMRYRGCGGNRNFFCLRKGCRKICEKSGRTLYGNYLLPDEYVVDDALEDIDV